MSLFSTKWYYRNKISFLLSSVLRAPIYHTGKESFLLLTSVKNLIRSSINWNKNYVIEIARNWMFDSMIGLNLRHGFPRSSLFCISTFLARSGLYWYHAIPGMDRPRISTGVFRMVLFGILNRYQLGLLSNYALLRTVLMETSGQCQMVPDRK